MCDVNLVHGQYKTQPQFFQKNHIWQKMHCFERMKLNLAKAIIQLLEGQSDPFLKLGEKDDDDDLRKVSLWMKYDGLINGP